MQTHPKNRPLISLISSIALASASPILSHAELINQSKTITSGGADRQYILYVPDGIDKKAPVVISLHGAAGHDSDRTPFKTSVADQAKCIVAYPQGENQNFGPFGIVPGWNASGDPNRDTQFLKDIVEDIAASFDIDRDRIYCCGFSNGGMMTYANANAAPDFFAAFASISGFQLNEFHHQFAGSRPVPFLHIHGKNDDFVKYSLMPVIRDGMVARNGLNPLPKVNVVDGKYKHSVYSPLAPSESFPYEYIEVDGMGHNDFTDRTPDNNSALTMWKFMSRFRLSDQCDSTLVWRSFIDLDGYDPDQHGWKINGELTRFEFGTSPMNNNADNNVYHSLQFPQGNFKLSTRVDGESDQTAFIKMETLGGKTLFSKKCPTNQDISIPFSIDTKGLFRIILLKSTPADKFSPLEFRKTSQPVSPENCEDSPLPEEKESGKLIEIPQNQGREYDDFARCDMNVENGYTQYTATQDLQIAFKMINVDVKDCDYLLIRFAEPVKAGWHVAFHEGTQLDAVPAGAEVVKFELTPQMISAGIAPQICLMTFYGTQTPLSAKVEGVYKHNYKIASSSIHSPEPTELPAANPNQWFDLLGRPIPQPISPGIYIHRGKKILLTPPSHNP